MILRKPYAFLIKYFRLIHIIMFIVFSYLVFSLRPIYIFFSDYVSGNNYMYFENMAQKYISPILFVMVIIVMAMAIGIYFLMRKKNKPILFYRLVIIYSFVLLVSLIYFYIFFKSLSNTNYTPLRLVINRDVIMILYYLNFIFVGFSFIRAFGFDIKKFSFDNDKKELQLEEGDNEEYELNIKVEKDDVVNYLNKQKRELRYYFMENSKFYKIVGIIVLSSLILYFCYSHFVINKVYHENEEVKIGNIIYSVRKSVITNVDKYGKEINKDNDFLIVYLNIRNIGSKITLDDQQFRINIGNKYYYPLVNYCDYFDDLGQCYHDSSVAENSNKDYILVYKLEKNYKKIDFEVLKRKSSSYDYSRILLSYTIDSKKVVDYNKGDVFTISNNEYQVLDYEILTKTSYVYDECKANKCNSYTKLVSPKLGNNVLVVEIKNLSKLTNEFLKNYVGLKYRNNTLYGSDIEIIDRYENKIYLGITSMVHKEDKIVLIFNTRNTEYDILLKDGVDE